MRQQGEELVRRGVRTLAITFGQADQASSVARSAGFHVPLLVDSSRSLYHAYGMFRGRWQDILGPAAWWAYGRALARGHRPRSATDDIRQLGGDVLIDPTGIVRLVHVGRGPADRPSVDELVRVLRRCD